MQGLVAEANKHTTVEVPEKGPVLDAQILVQYRRMCHYGIAGFGIVTSYAKELGLKDDHKQRSSMMKDVYGSDEFATTLAKIAHTADKTVE